MLGKKQNWSEAKKLMASPKEFIETLMRYNKDNVSKKIIDGVGKYTSRPDFTPEAMRKVSKAAYSLLLWVLGIEAYCRALQ